MKNESIYVNKSKNSFSCKVKESKTSGNGTGKLMQMYTYMLLKMACLIKFANQ